jgi:GT2 family glycosyltransferase
MQQKSTSLGEPRVRIVILNWNSYEVLDCLLSLQKIDYPNFEIVLVDNGSVDGSPTKLLANATEIRLIRNATNLGFAGGSNVGGRDAIAGVLIMCFCSTMTQLWRRIFSRKWSRLPSPMKR